jgi:hypothetical protein
MIRPFLPIMLLALLATGAARAGEFVWRGDGSRSLNEQWASVSDQSHCGVRTTAGMFPDGRIGVERTGIAATSSKGYAVHFQLYPGDNCYSGRSELTQRRSPGRGLFYPGKESWVADEVLFAPDFPLYNAKDNGGTLMQFHDSRTGASTVALSVNKGGKFVVWGEYLPGHSQVFYTGVVASVWYKVVFRIRWSEAASGLVQLFMGVGHKKPTLRLEDRNVKTLRVGEVPGFATEGYYAATNRTETPHSDSYIAGYNEATTRAAAERYAFTKSAATKRVRRHR